jgi:stalled ribosome rescue protein Dom34
MDRDEAKIFSLNPDRKDLELVRRIEIKHHTHADPENHKKTQPYFQEIAEHIRKATEILLIGPGQIKIQFSHHLKEVYPHTLGRMIIGVETVDHPTDKQILEFSRNFFRHHNPVKYPVA